MRYLLTILIALLATFPGPGFGQEYPNRPITLVVTFPAGGIADQGGRVFAKELSTRLGQPVVVENKAGASGIVGAEYAANAKPDGYTLLMSGTGISVIYEYLYKKLSYDPKKSFQSIYGMAMSPLMIAVRPDSPYRNVEDLVEAAKKNPEKITFATIGLGSVHHIMAELFQKDAGIKLSHIPYKGAAPAFVDFLAGVVDVMIDYENGLSPLQQAGKVRILATSAPKRLQGLPDVPTFAELGYKNTVISAISLIVAPAGTPKPIVDKLTAASEDIFNSPSVIKYYADRGSQRLSVGGAELDSFLDDQRGKVKAMIDQSGMQLEQ